jgi:hypothetical protein
MTTGSPQIHDLARRLLALEAARGQPSYGQGDEAVRICEKLRALLSKLVGVAGFGSLLSRALALAKAEVPSLGRLRVRTDGSLEGFEEVEWDLVTEARENGGHVLVAQLLGLLITFIGLSLTLSLLRDAWSDATLGGMDLSTEEMP